MASAWLASTRAVHTTHVLGVTFKSGDWQI